MSVELSKGDLLRSGADALVNPVNCVGVMGKGLALAFKKAYPLVFRDYAAACKAGEVAPGRLLTVRTRNAAGTRWIIHFPTKRHWRDSSILEDIDAGLSALAAEAVRLELASLAVPALGCGLGGLAWDEVRPRIERALGSLPDARVLLYPPG